MPLIVAIISMSTYLVLTVYCLLKMQGYTRVYLLCEVQISRALPSFIVDYAAVRAMPRATTWLRPLVEAAGDLWLKEPNQ
jgi:hypothetical protein